MRSQKSVTFRHVSGMDLGLHLVPDIERELQCYQAQLELLEKQNREVKQA